ncbi:unnamed protein product [Bursaphelenchus xylophilus]|uniref:(pine wood nematode) hypothetical protein n=1 Tax=Bursaphelenchus xylophilus TaxID=6326 RepID=A0A811K8Q8_BURXY|nr:unnamed protein product [Bursaphelenchus xylophilus]CAG9088929.1 unnamed protein product [Bursaphelenchus xylophilus]
MASLSFFGIKLRPHWAKNSDIILDICEAPADSATFGANLRPATETFGNLGIPPLWEKGGFWGTLDGEEDRTVGTEESERAVGRELPVESFGGAEHLFSHLATTNGGHSTFVDRSRCVSAEQEIIPTNSDIDQKKSRSYLIQPHRKKSEQKLGPKSPIRLQEKHKDLEKDKSSSLTNQLTTFAGPWNPRSNASPEIKEIESLMINKVENREDTQRKARQETFRTYSDPEKTDENVSGIEFGDLETLFAEPEISGRPTKVHLQTDYTLELSKSVFMSWSHEQERKYLDFEEILDNSVYRKWFNTQVPEERCSKIGVSLRRANNFGISDKINFCRVLYFLFLCANPILPIRSRQSKPANPNPTMPHPDYQPHSEPPEGRVRPQPTQQHSEPTCAQPRRHLETLAFRHYGKKEDFGERWTVKRIERLERRNLSVRLAVRAPLDEDTTF